MPEAAMQIPMPDSLFSRLSDFLIAQMGLNYPRERRRDLERGIAAAAREFGFSETEACVRWLLSAPLTRNQIEILAGHLSVGETYFFREKRSFEALEEHIVPQLLRARGDAGLRLRIWSAGCCTGEEPYSIAMLLDRLIPDLEKWSITILATDISPRFLRKAAEGIYGEWSFRDTPAWIRERYFNRRKDGRFEIKPHIRKRVTFCHLNLAEDGYPSLWSNTNAMDVIFCRNVLMYFAAEQTRKVAGRLHRCLVDGGWLITSPTEASNITFSAFTAVEFPGVVLYRKMAGGGPQAAVIKPQVPVFDEQAWAFRPQHPGVPPQPAVVDEARPASPKDAPDGPEQIGSVEAHSREQDEREAPSRAARICADQGKLAEAIDWCSQAIAADKLNPAHHYLLAAIQQEQGQSDAAERSFKRTLYLDPDFALAHFALGNLRLSQGRRREARRHFGNARALLQARPQDELLLESGGLTAGRLGEIILSAQESLPRAHEELLE
ncbi:MAG: CheR family methyltransferase [Burkholderiales bacterium]